MNKHISANTIQQWQSRGRVQGVQRPPQPPYQNCGYFNNLSETKILPTTRSNLTTKLEVSVINLP